MQYLAIKPKNDYLSYYEYWYYEKLPTFKKSHLVIPRPVENQRARDKKWKKSECTYNLEDNITIGLKFNIFKSLL